MTQLQNIIRFGLAFDRWRTARENGCDMIARDLSVEVAEALYRVHDQGVYISFADGLQRARRMSHELTTEKDPKVRDCLVHAYQTMCWALAESVRLEVSEEKEAA